jgi:RNA 2',3'-cyclic 3'-phosphodiesterase
VRLFVAIELPDSWRDAAREARATIETALPDARLLRWVDPDLMHLTLRFLGEVDEGPVETLRERLDEIAPFDVAIAGGTPGTFGPPRRTQVVWLGVGGDVARLEAVAREVEAAAVAAGLPPDERTFRPHVTLARVRREATPAQREAVARAVGALDLGLPAPSNVSEVALVRSHLIPRGPHYEVLSRHPRPVP